MTTFFIIKNFHGQYVYEYLKNFSSQQIMKKIEESNQKIFKQKKTPIKKVIVLNFWPKKSIEKKS